jgi:hypothetical protein
MEGVVRAKASAEASVSAIKAQVKNFDGEFDRILEASVVWFFVVVWCEFEIQALDVCVNHSFFIICPVGNTVHTCSPAVSQE